MPRRLSLLVLAVLATLALGAGSAAATIDSNVQWDVSLSGKQTVKWSFSGSKPEECVSYYGSASAEANGSGNVAFTFATKKPLWAETYVLGKKLKFLSFSTSGWKIPAVFTKHGKFVLAYGMPCGSRDDEPAPVPKFTDDSECGTDKTYMRPTLEWENGELAVRGSVSVDYYEGCPGVFDQGMQVDPEEPCTPKDRQSGIEGGDLQELPIPVSAEELKKGKAFSVDANHAYRCEFPSEWPGEPPLKVELTTRYEVGFKPRRD
jgi:hypothetical protein